MKKLQAIDLCAGAGGWACAARGLPIEITLAVDMWDRACKTYELNSPDTRTLCGDLRDKEIQTKVLELAGGADLVLGGIPCEQLSVCRNMKLPDSEEIGGFRSTLDSVLDLVKELGPGWWCLEDVKGIVKELPPLTPWVEIDSAGYSAQRRKRVYVGRFPMPTPGDCIEVAADRLLPGPHRIGPRGFGREPSTHGSFDAGSILPIHPDCKSPTVCAWESRRDADVAVIDTSLPGGLRQIHWLESARLQGFPEDFLFYGSPSDAAKMVGQAIQIDTGRAILEAIAREAREKGAL